MRKLVNCFPVVKEQCGRERAEVPARARRRMQRVAAQMCPRVIMYAKHIMDVQQACSKPNSL
jgi:hypothetical protein